MTNETIDEEIHKLILEVKGNEAARNGVQIMNMLAMLNGNSSDNDSCLGFSKMYDVSIPIWQSTMDYFKIMTKEQDVSITLEEKEEEIVRIIHFINDSQSEIVEALLQEHSASMKDFRPSKVSSVLFDYSGDKPEFSFYVASNEEYHFHVYIKDDMSFDVDCIS